MYNARKRGFASGIDVCGGTGNRAGGGETAKQGAGQIGDALGDEFGVAVMPVAGKSVGHDRGKQLLNRA